VSRRIGQRLCVLAAALGLGVAGLAALGQELGAAGFDGADANQDGQLDPGEWDRAGAQLFERIDADGDGLASVQELRQAFDSFDADGDGTIEAGESPLVIILGDADEDGAVTPAEFAAIDWARQSLDLDGDGALSRNEFRDARREIYDRADFDRSVSLNRSEYQGAPSLSLFRF